jgi:holin-like protein
MPVAILILIGCQLLGELVREAFTLPIPGPVIGMLLLAAGLGVRAKVADGSVAPMPLRSAAETLIANMGLLFVPAGVGIVAEFGLLRKEWLPIVAAVIGSTILSIAVTGLLMHWMMRATQQRSSGTVSLPATAQGSGV